MTRDRDALVTASLALRHVAKLAWAQGARGAAVEALAAAKRAEESLGLSTSGCKGCGGPVEASGRGRPRTTCQTCRPPRLGQYRANMPETASVEP